MSGTPILELKGVSKHFGAVQALTDVDFEVRTGEVMALVGDNGAGKSTLIKGIAGIYPFDGGEIFFENKRVNIHGPRDCAGLGIEIVYQDLALADNLDVVANMFLGREMVQRPWRLDETSMEQACLETLDSLVSQYPAFGAAGRGGTLRWTAPGHCRRQGCDVEFKARNS